MRLGPTTCLALLALALASRAVAATVATWTCWEQSLTSTKEYANPFADVSLSVTYTGPGGETGHAWGFWDGGNVFKIRHMFPTAGVWKWRTVCTDAADAGLHGRSGVVEVTPYAGSNVLRRRGYLKVAAGQRHLAYADGTPFLWIGDTTWSGLQAATLDEWRTYVDDRRAKGFTVIQSLCFSSFRGLEAATDRAGSPPFLQDGLVQWNPAFWQGVEEKIRYANEQGLVFMLTGFPGYREQDTTPLARAEFLARNIVSRFLGDFVVFSPAMDDDSLSSVREDALGRAARAATALHLVTQHPNPFVEFALKFHDKDYVDFAGEQSGRGKDFGKPNRPAKAAREAIMSTLQLYHRSPWKPVIDLEGFYDGSRAQLDLPRQARSCAYLALLSGACGYTYGCRGLVHWDADPYKNEPEFWPWRKALNVPSSTEIAHLVALFSSLEWWRLVPRHELIRNNPADDWLRRMVFAAVPEGDLAVAYLPDNGTIELDLSSFPASLRGRWFNPVTGESAAIATPISNAPDVTFERPASGDWVLVITTAARTR